MGDTKVNGLLAALDAAWTVHVTKRADVHALVRVLRGETPIYVLFGNPRRHEEINGRCQEITHMYTGKLEFETQVLHADAYASMRERIQPKIKEGIAKILYENKPESDA
jgi:hypothetical protein